MNRPFLRALAIKLGYSVTQRSCHGPGKAWDWGPKSPLGAAHFCTEAQAWTDLENAMQLKFEQAEALLRAAAELVRADQQG